MEFSNLKDVLLIVFALLAGLEVTWTIFVKRQAFPWGEALASLGVALGKRLIDAFTVTLLAAVFMGVWDYRLNTVDMTSPVSWVLLFFLFEFAYYWMHRLSHTVRWFWANHSVHHSAEHLNFFAAIRLGWLGVLSGMFAFYLPLVLVGFHPGSVIVMLVVNLGYQLWLHTELIGKLGPVEWIFNTPSHHRVHHASNPEYLDKNFGGVLIIYDRMFGSFAAERADIAPKYGLVEPINSRNPIKIALSEWWGIVRDVSRARSWKERAHACFGRPGAQLAASNKAPELGAMSTQND